MNTIATAQPGDFGLTSITGYAGQLIRFGQWLNGDGYSTFEHAFIVIDNDQIVEAEPGGARHAWTRPTGGQMSEYEHPLIGRDVLDQIAMELRFEASMASPEQAERLQDISRRVDEVSDGWGVDYV